MAELTRIDIIKLLARRTKRRDAIKLRGVDLSGLDLSHFDLSHVDLSYANLKNCTLCGAHFGSATLSDCCFELADMRSASLDHAVAHSASFSMADLSPLPGHFRPSFLENAEFQNCDFGGADLRDADAVLGWFKGCRFAAADLRGFQWNAATFAECDFTDARQSEGNRMPPAAR